MNLCQFAVRATALAICVLFANSCSAPAPDLANTGVSSPSGAQESSWELPTDSFVMTEVEVAVSELAEDYLVQDCMAEQGQTWQVTHVSESELAAPARSPGGLRIFDEEIAATLGYRFPPVFPAQVTAERQRLNSVELTATQEAAFAACLAAARDQLGSLTAVNLSNSIAVRTAGSWESAAADDAVTQAAERWRGCMKPEGIPDLPDAPYSADSGMPTPSMMASWGGADYDTSTSPTAAEIAVASADAACRTSSGYAHAFYQAVWKHESLLLHDDPTLADDGRRAREVYDTLLADSRAILAAHGGA